MPAGNRVVRWEQRGENILFRDVRYTIRAETDDPIAGAVAASNLAPIIRVFPVKAYGKDKAPVIEVTKLFTKDVPELSAKQSLNAGGMDDERSFIEAVKCFPRNLETRVLATYSAKEDERSSGLTALIHHSMVLLPESPMKPRRHDSRVGFFSVGFTDYADDSNHEAEPVRYITRWRLEKKDPNAETCDPVKPIVFYVGRGVPEKWKPYVKAGIEQWRPAFEAAGFTNAIIGEYAPDPRDDPDWDAEDARISTIRWLPADITNAFGPHVHDPRTGEILEADVRMFHNVQKLVRDWYFVQASAVDERAQKLPMPDDLMGELIQFVVAHEVGHSIGFPHNMKASSSYSVAQLRDPEWTRKNGTAPSIMDYARFNYVAQPGDGAALMPAVGPYDHFATEWGYRQFPPEDDEKEMLELICRRQIDTPMLRFGGGGDPTAQTEDLSSDAVEAMIPDDIVLRLTRDGVADRLLVAQSGLLRQLVNAGRINRMAEHADRGRTNPYRPAEMLADLRDGLFRELDDDAIEIDLYRRNLQRTYVEHLGSTLDAPAAGSDLPALARAELVRIREMLDDRADAAKDGAVAAHVADLAARIDAALDPQAR